MRWRIVGIVAGDKATQWITWNYIYGQVIVVISHRILNPFSICFGRFGHSLHSTWDLGGKHLFLYADECEPNNKNIQIYYSRRNFFALQVFFFFFWVFGAADRSAITANFLNIALLYSSLISKFFFFFYLVAGFGCVSEEFRWVVLGWWGLPVLNALEGGESGGTI